MDSIAKKMPSNAKQVALVIAWQRDRSPAAHDELTRIYRPILEREVDSFRLWNVHGTQRDALIMLGWSGLLNAIETFDATLGLPFYGHAQGGIEFSLYKHANTAAKQAA